MSTSFRTQKLIVLLVKTIWIKLTVYVEVEGGSFHPVCLVTQWSSEEDGASMSGVLIIY